jgi:hypothetical protein
MQQFGAEALAAPLGKLAVQVTPIRVVVAEEPVLALDYPAVLADQD